MRLQIDLTEEEAKLVREILHDAFQNLREEIYKTDSSHYKEQLKTRETALEALVKKLGG